MSPSKDHLATRCKAVRMRRASEGCHQVKEDIAVTTSAGRRFFAARLLSPLQSTMLSTFTVPGQYIHTINGVRWIQTHWTLTLTADKYVSPRQSRVLFVSCFRHSLLWHGYLSSSESGHCCHNLDGKAVCCDASLLSYPNKHIEDMYDICAHMHLGIYIYIYVCIHICVSIYIYIYDTYIERDRDTYTYARNLPLGN